MNYDTYFAKVLSRLLTPGVGMLIVGAVVGYASGAITRGIADNKKRNIANLVVKGLGCAIAIAGAVLVFA